MKPPPLRHVAPTSAAEAVEALADPDGQAKVLAGGQSLIPLLNMRLIAPTTLVDINRVEGLDQVTVDAEGVTVGATVRQRDLEDHARAMAAHPLLAQALPLVAHQVIRNRGTVAGSIAHADPAAELPAVLALTRGEVVVSSTRGTRVVAAADFFRGPLEADLHHGELVTQVRFGAVAPTSGTAVLELSRRHGDYAICGIAALVDRNPDGSTARARIATIGVHPTPLVVDLTGAITDWPDADPQDAADLVAEQVDPDADLHASVAYRRHLARVLTIRAVRTALAAGTVDGAAEEGGPA